MKGSVSKSTDRIYEPIVKEYRKTCARLGIVSFPPTIHSLYEFLKEKITCHSQAYVNTAIAAITHQMNIYGTQVTDQIKTFYAGARRLSVDKRVKIKKTCTLTIPYIKKALKKIWQLDDCLDKHRVLLMIILALQTNLRLSDSLNLTKAHFQFKENEADIYSGIRKNDQLLKDVRVVTLPRMEPFCQVTAMEISLFKLGVHNKDDFVFYNTQKPWQPVTASTIHHALKRVFTRIDMKKFTMQDIRAAVLKHLIMTGANKELCAQLRGWRETSSLKYYSVLSAVEMKEYAKIFM